MKILIFAASWYNRGDEAAIRSMIDELKRLYPSAVFKMHFATMQVEETPYKDIPIVPNFFNVRRRNFLGRVAYGIAVRSRGKICFLGAAGGKSGTENGNALKAFIRAVKWCDLAVYAPGGPNIGDLYRTYILLDCIDLLRAYKKPYVFYAPSMGPFKQYKRRIARAIRSAAAVCLREEVSAGYVRKLVPGKEICTSLDAAFQHSVDTTMYQKQMQEYPGLTEFLQRFRKVVGITVTDLQWHSLYKGHETVDKIGKAFRGLLSYLYDNGYGVVFIPQLFGKYSDKEYMSGFSGEHCFVLDAEHDCYFQQYLIAQLYAVVGMRYHSNIFSAKAGVPFVSVAYEQKMTGFMQKTGLSEYCLSLAQLSESALIARFEKLCRHHEEYKLKLSELKEWCRTESYRTTQTVAAYIQRAGLDR